MTALLLADLEVAPQSPSCDKQVFIKDLSKYVIISCVIVTSIVLQQNSQAVLEESLLVSDN